MNRLTKLCGELVYCHPTEKRYFWKDVDGEWKLSTERPDIVDNTDSLALKTLQELNKLIPQLIDDSELPRGDRFCMLRRISLIETIIKKQYTNEGKPHSINKLSKVYKVRAAYKKGKSLYKNYERDLKSRNEWMGCFLDSKKRINMIESQSLDKQSALVSSMEKVQDEMEQIKLQLKKPDIAPDSAKLLESKLEELNLKYNELYQSLMNEMYEGDEELIAAFKKNCSNFF
ncbi:MAG: hypothetical protein H7A37_09430 [Chlamydiales bacterium]|nr:hypothetical protein [Chlamydiales bacterium]